MPIHRYLISMTLICAGVVFSDAIQLRAQTSTAAAGVTFDVVSIKPVKPGESYSSGRKPSAPGRLRFINATLFDFIQWAYKLPDFRILGGAKWVSNDRFTLDAVSE